MLLKKGKKGFTLIELLAVVMIIGILTTIALPGYRRSVERARVAEALTLMRAIFDSCERLAWENGFDTTSESVTSCAAGVGAGDVVFQKLDISAKGTFSPDGKTLTTANFAYTLGSDTPITARFIGNDRYEGAVITFDGGWFSCDNGTAKDDACTAWGSTTWNHQGA